MKFKQSNVEAKDGQKYILDTAKAKWISYDGSETLINTTLSGVTPTADGHLTTKAYVDSEITTATGSLTTDHGSLTGLSDDDHTQYHNDTRGDARYYTQSQVDTISGAINTSLTDHTGTSNIHFTEASIDHDNITNTHNLTTDIDHDQLTNYVAGEHFLESNISHTSINNIGTNTHAQIDTHIANDAIHGAGGGGTAGELDLGAIKTVNGEYAGITISGVVNAAPAVGDVLYQKSDFSFAKGSATTSGNDYPVYAMATSTDTGTVDLLLQGQLCNTSWNWSAGMLWLSTTVSGGMQQTVASGVGQGVQPVGFALSADTVYFTGYVGHGRL